MKQCDKYDKDPKHISLRRIFSYLISSHCQLSVAHFNTIFNLMSDSPLLCSRYFTAMTNIYKVTPNVITFCILIKSCKTDSRIRTANKYWYLMKHKYDIRPNNIIYKELIAVYSTKPDRAKKVFDEYLQRIDHKEVKPETSTFRAYLDIFSSVGDIKGMKSVVKIMKEYGIDIDVNIVTDIMNGYLIGGNPQNALKTCNNYISKKGNSSKIGIVLGLKCQSLNEMIHKLSDNELDKKHTLYADLENTIYHQFV